MLKSQLIAALQKSVVEQGDGAISEPELIEIAADGNRRRVDEWHARAAMVLDVARAKRDAGFRRDAMFFRDVWPIALAALLRERAQVRCLSKVDPSPPSVPPMEGGAAGIIRGSAAGGDLS